ncbi:MAG: peptide ABC transporter ATP-binding protein [Chloroflexi bacterium]|nr:MAG: peptide ABC transporter ATP-binding protein [Chloroflexota bacterium]
MSEQRQTQSPNTLLDIRGLVTRFYTEDGVVNAVNGVSYAMEEGGTLGVVGESGCGKSVHALSIMRLIPSPPGRIEEGEVWFSGRDLLKVSEGEMHHVRGAEIAMVFQDPMTSLNPVYTVGFQIMEALKLHQGMDNAQARERSGELLTLVGIPDAVQRLDNYPHQFSGGMRQRAMIAMGLSCNPKLLIADEPTTALDVTIQAQILDLVKRLQEQLGMAVMWITHDLGVIAGLASKVNVMYAGYIVERGDVKDIYGRSRHPYTMGLLGSLPRLDDAPGTQLISIPGLPPDLIDLPPGCPFAARCTFAVDRCLEEMPPLEDTDGEGHIVACWRWKQAVGRTR